MPSGLSRWGPVVLWMAAIFYGSSLSRPLKPLGALAEKEPVGVAAHVMEYAGLTVLLRRALAKNGSLKDGPWVGPLVIALAYAVSDEIHQKFVPGRYCELFDVGCDAAGSIMALVAFHAGDRHMSARRINEA